jgi:hypothetical protein
MGYFRGGGRRISDLAHRVRSADLARAMLRHANDPVQTAYAWGWVTHMLADVAVHPLINRATGELIDGRLDRVIVAAESPASHLRVELGLDAYFQTHHCVSYGARFGAAIPRARMRFLSAAYQLTYGDGPGLDELFGAQIAILRLAPLLLALSRLFGEVHRGLRRCAEPAALRQAAYADDEAGAEGALAILRSFLNPVAPRPWLVREVGSVVRGFADTFLDHYHSRLRELANYDLDTGCLASGQEKDARAA